jgi:hypothetical protein
MLINPGDTILVNEPLFPGTLYAVSTYFYITASSYNPLDCLSPQRLAFKMISSFAIKLNSVIF